MAKFDIEVELVGNDGNAFVIMGSISMAIREAGGSDEDVKEYKREAMSGDYDNLLRVSMDWVDVV